MNGSTSGGRRDHLERSDNMADAFLHACQTKTFCHLVLRRRKASSFIDDVELELPVRRIQSHYDLLGSAVFRSVLQSFLSRSKHTERDIAVECFGNLSTMKIDLETPAS